MSEYRVDRNPGIKDLARSHNTRIRLKKRLEREGREISRPSLFPTRKTFFYQMDRCFTRSER
jgi:hypothetical protein